MKIGYLGPEGTHSERAAKSYAASINSDFVELFPCSSIPLTFEKICSGDVEQIVVPVENSIEGTVNITLDMLFLHSQLHVVKEITIKINHCLLSKCSAQSIKTIYSHPQALAQCHNFINCNFKDVEIIPVESTAQAAKLAAQKSNSAAVASLEAAEKYKLRVLRRAIQDYRANMTSFWIISKDNLKLVSKSGIYKTSLVVALPHNKPGGLYGILGVLADHQINLTKIQSRPTKKELGEYLFFIDFEGYQRERHIQESLKILREMSSYLRILGSYHTSIGGGGSE